MMNIKKQNTMKHLFSLSAFFISTGFAVFFSSCKYEEIASVDFPAGKLYLPMAYNGVVYTINDITQPALAVPTQGTTYQYVINKEANEFIIPLSVYRSGLDPGEAITVAVSENPDIVAALKENGTLQGEVYLLPSGRYTLDATVKMEKGQVISPFELVIDLNYLHQQALSDRIKKKQAEIANPDTIHASLKYALGITISSAEQECNPDLNTVVILIDTRIMLPDPSFTFTIDRTEKEKVTFRNSSSYANTFLWDFGDGSEKSSEENPPVHIYPALEEEKDYTVSLTVTGLLGEEVKETGTQIVSIKRQ
jgi:hypothetical protein